MRRFDAAKATLIDARNGIATYLDAVQTARADRDGAQRAFDDCQARTPAEFSLSPSTIDFGAYVPGSTSTRQVTITNTGTSASETIDFSISGADASEFVTDSSDCPTTLTGGSSCTVAVAFAPSALGDKTATYTVEGAPGGTAPLTGLAAPSGVTLVPAAYDYGSVPAGGAEFFTFRVVNTTDNPEGMNSASSDPSFPLELNQDFTCILVKDIIEAHGWCTMTLSFKPQGEGSFGAVLTAAGNNFRTTSQMSGTGTAAPAASRSASPDRPILTSILLRDGEVVRRR